MSKLTRNVTREHLKEIMSYYGVVQTVDFTKPGSGGGPSKTATVEFESTEMCDKAIKHMDAGEKGAGIDFTNLADFKTVVTNSRSKPGQNTFVDFDLAEYFDSLQRYPPNKTI